MSRRFELLRGRWLSLRGGQVGSRFGLGRAARIMYPSGFTAGSDVTIGDYAYVHNGTDRGVRIGSHCSIDRNLWLHCGETGFFSMGDHSYIGCNAVIGAGGGGIRIGSNVLIGQGVSMHSEKHRYESADQLIRLQGVRFEGIEIGDDVWIGSRVVILDGVTIETGAVVGAGSVVTKSIPAYQVAVGAPARVTGSRV